MIARQTIIQEPQQARSRRSLRQVYTATSRLLEKRSFDQLTVMEIAKRAKVSVGSIYQRFENKDALLLSLHDHYISECESKLDRIDADLSGASTEDRIATLVELTTGLFAQWHGVIRSMHLRQLSGVAEIAESDSRRIKSIYAKMVRILVGKNVKSLQTGNARLSLSLILAMCRQRYVFKDRTEELCFYGSDEQFFHRLVNATAAVFRAKPVL